MKSKIINRVRERALLKSQREEIRRNWEIISAQIEGMKARHALWLEMPSYCPPPSLKAGGNSGASPRKH